MKNKSTIIFIAILVLVVAGFFVFNSFLKKNMLENISKDNIDKLNTSLVVPKQAGGMNIFIENVILGNDGYVVIHRDEDGKPGVIIGVSELLSKGTVSNFLIDIDEEIVEGDSLFAVVHKDDGDKVFSPDMDVPALDDEGNIVLVRFDIVGEGALDDEVKL